MKYIISNKRGQYKGYAQVFNKDNSGWIITGHRNEAIQMLLWVARYKLIKYKYQYNFYKYNIEQYEEI